MRNVRELKRVRLQAKPPFALVEEQQRAVGSNDKEILAAIIVKIRKKSARRIFKDANAGCFRDVVERSVATVSIKPVGETGRLANVDIVEAIVIDVANSHAVVAVNVNAARAVQTGAPIVHSVNELLGIRGIVTDRLLRDIRKPLLSGSAAGLAVSPPVLEPVVGRPLQLPKSHALFTMEISSAANQLIAHAGL